MTILEKVQNVTDNYGKDSATAALARAVGVLCCTPSTARFLQTTDPQALKQAEVALDYAIERSQPPRGIKL